MKRQWIICALIASRLLAGGPAHALAPVVEFKGDSTLHAFGGSATVRAVEWSPSDSGFRGVAVVVDAHSMRTGNSSRDANMHHLLDVLKFPTVEGRLGGIPAAWFSERAPGEAVDMEIQLAIRGIDRPVSARVQPISTESGERALDVAFTVSLEAFNLKPPSVIGLIRVRDAVQVRALIPLSPEGSSDP